MSTHGFTQDGARRIVRATRYVEDAKRRGIPLYRRRRDVGSVSPYRQWQIVRASSTTYRIVGGVWIRNYFYHSSGTFPVAKAKLAATTGLEVGSLLQNDGDTNAISENLTIWSILDFSSSDPGTVSLVARTDGDGPPDDEEKQLMVPLGEIEYDDTLVDGSPVGITSVVNWIDSAIVTVDYGGPRVCVEEE